MLVVLMLVVVSCVVPLSIAEQLPPYHHHRPPSDITLVGFVDGSVQIVDTLTGTNLASISKRKLPRRRSSAASGDASRIGSGLVQQLVVDSLGDVNVDVDTATEIPALQGQMWSGQSGDAAVMQLSNPFLSMDLKQLRSSIQDIVASQVPLELQLDKTSLLVGDKVTRMFGVRQGRGALDIEVDALDDLDLEASTTTRPGHVPFLFLARTDNTVRCVDALTGVSLWSITMSSFSASLAATEGKATTTKQTGSHGQATFDTMTVEVSADGKRITVSDSKTESGQPSPWTLSGEAEVQTVIRFQRQKRAVTTVFDSHVTTLRDARGEPITVLAETALVPFYAKPLPALGHARSDTPLPILAIAPGLAGDTVDYLEPGPLHIIASFFFTATAEGVSLSWRAVMWTLITVALVVLVAVGVGVLWARKKPMVPAKPNATAAIERVPLLEEHPLAPGLAGSMSAPLRPVVPKIDPLASLASHHLPPRLELHRIGPIGTTDLRRSMSAADLGQTRGIWLGNAPRPSGSPAALSSRERKPEGFDFSFKPPSDIVAIDDSLARDPIPPRPRQLSLGALDEASLLPQAAGRLRMSDEGVATPLGTPRSSQATSLAVLRQGATTPSQSMQLKGSGMMPVCARRYANEFQEGPQLGHGGFGAVFRSRNRLDGREYAIKKVRLSSAPQWQGKLQKVLREVQVLAVMDHSNVVRYYQAWLEKADSADATAPGVDDSSTMSATMASKLTSGLRSPRRRRVSSIESAGSESASSESAHGDKGESSTDASMGAFVFSREPATAMSSPASSPAEHETDDADVSEVGRTPSPSKTAWPDRSRVHSKLVFDLMLYIQMQFCAQRTLLDHLSDPGRAVDPQAVVSQVAQIARGIHHVHQCGIIHRDLKPANIFFMDDGTIKLGDFGLSRHVASGASALLRKESMLALEGESDRESATGLAAGDEYTGAMGTFLYASPEQVAGQAYDEKTDMFSLGMILAEMLHTPFSTAMERAVTMQRMRQLVLPEEWETSKVLGSVLPILRQLLCAKPNVRPTAAAVAEMCDKLAKPNPSLMSPSGTDRVLLRVVAPKYRDLHSFDEIFTEIRKIVRGHSFEEEHCAMYTNDHTLTSEFTLRPGPSVAADSVALSKLKIEIMALDVSEVEIM